MRQISWPLAFLLSFLGTALLSSVTILALANKDVGDILSAVSVFLLAIIGALGFAAKAQIEQKVETVSQKTDQVHDVANGRLTSVLMANERLQKQVTELALQIQPKQDPPADDNDPSV